MNDLFKYWPLKGEWTQHLKPVFESEAWRSLGHFVASQRSRTTVFPAPQDVFRAFKTPGFRETKVVILGQDPYHGAGQAHGLSFSVPDGIKIPPSLRNIFRELKDDLGSEVPRSGNLNNWARQGVFLLNTVLTVNEGEANSHQKQGWEQFTDRVIQVLNEHPLPLVFVFWGKSAEAKSRFIDKRHEIIISAHPSPLSARRGFWGSKPFSRANTALVSFGRDPVNWNL